MKREGERVQILRCKHGARAASPRIHFIERTAPCFHILVGIRSKRRNRVRIGTQPNQAVSNCLADRERILKLVASVARSKWHSSGAASDRGGTARKRIAQCDAFGGGKVRIEIGARAFCTHLQCANVAHHVASDIRTLERLVKVVDHAVWQSRRNTNGLKGT
jgi:hypothetical protein